MQKARHPAAGRQRQLVPLAEGVERHEQAAAGEVVAILAVPAHQLEPLRERGRVVARERVVRRKGVACLRVGRVHVETRAQGGHVRVGIGRLDERELRAQQLEGRVVGRRGLHLGDRSGGSRDVGRTSDVYSLGIVLYELLSGSVPFPRSRTAEPYLAAIEVVRQHLKCEPEPLRKRSPDAHISSQVERATMRALKKNVKDRYASAKELGEALGADQQAGQAPLPGRRAPNASLAILQGPRQGERIAVGEGLSVGRYDLRSSDTTISRQHARISCRAGGYWLEDLSKNGTWVNGQRVYGEVPLPIGATIAIADNLLRLEEPPETRGGRNV